MSRVDVEVEVRFVGPSFAAWVVAAFGFFGSLGAWWLLYFVVGLTQPDWLALALGMFAGWGVGLVVGGHIESKETDRG